jgi:uncharacterized protein
MSVSMPCSSDGVIVRRENFPWVWADAGASGTMPDHESHPMIVYIHGFNSSPASTKANQLRSRLATLGREQELVCPALSHWPAEAFGMLEKTIAGCAPDSVTLVGSSLGGFYATALTGKYGVRSVLVNPGITPHEGLRAYLGPQKNLHTGEPYEFSERHLEQMAALYVARPTKLDRYLLLHTTGDELLDWRIAADHYAGCRQIIVQGGDHGFEEFERYLDIVLAFAK